MHGALLVDKPSGPTSHDVVAFTRRLLKTSRVGHTGTLDPLATGLLVLLVGHATRLSRFLVADEKEYLADVRLGMATPTYDAASLPADGLPLSAVRAAPDSRYPTDAEIETVLDRFRGSFLQTPPPYSAKKVAGVPSYERARKNQTVNLQPVRVTVQELQVLRASDSGQRIADSGQRRADSGSRTADSGPRTADSGQRTADSGQRTADSGQRTADSGQRTADSGLRTADSGHGSLVRLRVVASAGFYVRSLAHDLGQALGCGAHLEALRRTRVGRFGIDQAATLDTLQADPDAGARLIPVNTLLADFPAVTPTEDGLRRASHGNPLSPAHLEKGDSPLFSQKKGAVPFFRVLDGSGEVVAVAEGRADGLLHPLVVLG